jgi:hypothetical protein
MSPTKIDNDATNSWNSYFKNRLGKKAIQNDCCFNNEDYQSVVYAIFSQDKLIYIGRSNDFEHRKTGHLREVLIQFFFRYFSFYKTYKNYEPSKIFI